MIVVNPDWAELIAAVIGAIAGWFTRHFVPPRKED